MDDKSGDTTLMPQRRDILHSGLVNDREDVSSPNATHPRPARANILEVGSMRITESVSNERTLKVSPTSLQEPIELKKPVKLAIVIPALNEERAIGSVLEEIHSTLERYKLAVTDSVNKVLLSLRLEIIVVDGGSTDDTVSVVKSRGVTLLRQRGTGYGDALVVGFRYAMEALDPDALVMIDGDGSYDAADIPRLLLPILSDEADVVLGNRFEGMQPGAMTFTNRVGNRMISWLASRLLGVRASDTQCGLRVLSPDVVNIFSCHANGMSFATEMLADAEQAGARIAEVSITYRPRIGNTKLRPLHDGATIVGIIIKLLRDYRPLLFFGGVGLALALAGLTLGFDVVLEYVYTGTVTRIPRAILTVLLLIAGVQLACLGLLADMIKGLGSYRKLPPVKFGKITKGTSDLRQ